MSFNFKKQENFVKLFFFFFKAKPQSSSRLVAGRASGRAGGIGCREEVSKAVRAGCQMCRCVCSLLRHVRPCDPTGRSPPGPSAQGLSPARRLAWVAISFSRAAPDPGIEPRPPTHLPLGISLPLTHLGSPIATIIRCT